MHQRKNPPRGLCPGGGLPLIAVSYCANGTPLSDVLTDYSVFAPNMVAATVFCSTVTFSILMLRVAIIMILTFTSYRA